MLLLITILLVLLITCCYRHYSNRHKRAAVANFDGPFCLPILGAIYAMRDVNSKNFLERLTVTFRQRYGKIFRMWVLNRLLVVSTDCEINEQLMTSQQHIVKQQNYQMLKQWLGVGLLMSDGRKWFTRRRIITPTFHFKILEEFVEVFDQQSTVLLKRLKSKANGVRNFDVYPFIGLATLDIIAETAMGTKINAQTDQGTAYSTAVHELTNLMTWRFLKFYLHNEFTFGLLHPFLKRRLQKLIRITHDFTTEVIEMRRSELESSLNKSETAHETLKNADGDIGLKKRSAFLDVLLQSTVDGQPLSNADIREEVDTFMFEGHDTTTSAISSALHFIARHKQVQERLLEEVRGLLGLEIPDKTITLNDLNSLKYTECVVKETLRLCTAAPLIARQIVEDFHYTHSKYGPGKIPAGTEFFVNLYGMMRDADNFPDPLKFIPERHLNSEHISSFTFIPFSAGPRNCIGQKFALLEMKMIIAKVVHEYELLPLGEDIVPELNIVMRSATGFQLGMRKRLP